MALADKNIVITPNIGQTDDPKLVVTAASSILGPQPLTIRGLPIRGGTLSFEGSAGQLLSVSNNMDGSLFSANDTSGIPSIEVLATGEVKLAEFGGNVLIRTGVNDGINALQVGGTSIINGGTVTANKPVLKLTQTWNNASEVFAGLDITITGTAYHATSQLFTVKLGSSQLMFLNGNGTLSIAGNMYSGADLAQGWTGRSKLKSPGDGVVTLLNNAEGDFARLQFGGTTSTFPALKRNGATLEARRADDSEYAAFRASNFIMSNNSRINDGGDGIIRFQNGAGDNVNRLVWGLMTSAFPSLKRDGTSLHARLADDSAFTDFYAKDGVFSGKVTGANLAGGLVATTAGGASSSTNYWAKIAEYSPNGANQDGNFVYAITNRNASGASSAIISVHIRGHATNPVMSVAILAMHGDFAFTDDSFKIVCSDVNVLELWVRKVSNFCNLAFYEISKFHNTPVTIAYFNDSVWQATEPVGSLFNYSSIGLQYRTHRVFHAGSPLLFTTDGIHDIGASAGNRPRDYFGTGSAIIGASGLFGFAGRGRIAASADGILTISNNAQTDFNRLNFGGNTSSFPSLKRVGALLEVRTANDSAYTGLKAEWFNSSQGNYFFGASSPSLPRLTNSGAELHVKLGDNSAFATLQTGDLIVNGNLTITGTQTVVSTTNLEVTDPIITLAKDNTAGSLQYMGLRLERGSVVDDAYLLWNEASDKFVFGTASDDTIAGWVWRPIAARVFESFVAQGTAPLTILSNTRVDNLNVQYLNSLESTDFVRSTGSVAETITGDKTFSAGQTGLSIGALGSSGRLNFKRASDNSSTGFVGFASGDSNIKLSLSVSGGASFIALATQGTDRWRVDTDGHLIAAADNAYDIGLTDTATRPRHIRARGLITASSGFVLGSLGYISFSSSSTIRSSADGNILLTNDAGTDFSLLQLGGTTSSFPAIKRDGNGLQLRRADDSTYATLRTGTLISYGAETTIGQEVVNQNITLNLGSGSGPGIGYASQINFKRATDSAGMQVTEITNDQTLYEFWMSDNPDGGDNFSWRYTDHQNVNGVWVPLYIGGKNMRFQAGNIDIWGGINQGGKHAAYYTTGDALHAAPAARNITYMNDLAKLPCKVNTGSITVTALNVSGYNGATDGQVIYIRATSATTFEWGHGRSAYNTPIDTGLAFSTSPVTLSNGITVTFSGTTGAVLHDEWAFRVWKPVTNQLAPSVLHGNITFNSDNAFDIGASGVNRPRNLYVANNVTASGGIYAATVMHTSATGYLGFNTRARMRSGADGVISLYNTAETDFSMLTFGGVTNSSPAIKRWSSGLHVRLADDSAFADLAARQVVASSDITIGGANLKFDLRSRISSTTDGVLLLQNAAADGFARLQFGGTTSAFPALRRHLNTLMLRVADDSNYAGLYCGFLHLVSPIYLGGTTNTSSSIRWTGTLVRLRLANDSNWAPLESASITANGNLSATGTLSHAGLTPTVGTSIDQIMTFTESLQMTGDWQDTSINATDLETGTYIVQLYVFDKDVGGGQWRENYSGVMSWHSASTNSSITDELVLHRAGHSPNQHSIYLRVARATTGAGAEMKLQISSTTTTTGVSDYVFKFRRVI